MSKKPLLKTGVGARLKKVDANIVFELAKIHCTLAEIAAVCKCSHDVIEKRFHDEYSRGRDEGRCCLRRMQWQQAMEGNTQMLIWLGKQMLSQRDKFPEEATQVNFNVLVQEVPK